MGHTTDEITIIIGGDINADCNAIDFIMNGEDRDAVATTSATRRTNIVAEWMAQWNLTPAENYNDKETQKQALAQKDTVSKRYDRF